MRSAQNKYEKLQQFTEKADDPTLEVLNFFLEESYEKDMLAATDHVEKRIAEQKAS